MYVIRDASAYQQRPEKFVQAILEIIVPESRATMVHLAQETN
jgi:hypothetical protein